MAAPQASFGGKSPYKDWAKVAAAYPFYLCRNDPFIDGNKRAALGACIVFLRLNGIEPKTDGPEWGKLTLAVADGELVFQMGSAPSHHGDVSPTTGPTSPPAQLKKVVHFNFNQ